MPNSLSERTATYMARSEDTCAGTRSLGVVVGLGLLVGLLYAPVLQNMVLQWWHDANYSHGFLVPIFSAYLAWRYRKGLAKVVGSGACIGLPVIIGGLGALILGDLAAEHFISRASLVVVLSGLILFHLGFKTFRLVAFPVAFLFFMIPLPAIIFNAIAFPLQGLAAQNATWALDNLGVPVLRDGNVIHLSHITLGVTEACSGIRSLISLLALAVAWGYLTIPGFWSKIIFVAATVPITIVANAVRVVATGLIGQAFGIEYAQGFFHAFSGWIVFVFAFACLLTLHGMISLIQRSLERRPESPRIDEG